MSSFLDKLGFKKLSTISFGLVASIFLLWAMFNSASFVPAGQGVRYALIFLGYGVLGSYVFTHTDINTSLFRTPFFKNIPRFLFYFAISFFVTYSLFRVSGVSFLSSAVSIFAGVPLYLMMIHAFIFATVESMFWQGFLDKRVGILFSALIAGLFHMFIWEGGVLTNLFASAFLFFIFSTAHHYINKSYKSENLVPVIAIHTAYNFIQLGLILNIVGSSI
jgi:hypothetical protein